MSTPHPYYFDTTTLTVLRWHVWHSSRRAFHPNNSYVRTSFNRTATLHRGQSRTRCGARALFWRSWGRSWHILLMHIDKIPVDKASFLTESTNRTTGLL